MSSKLIAIVAEVAKAESLVLVVQGVVHLFRGSLSFVRRVGYSIVTESQLSQHPVIVLRGSCYCPSRAQHCAFEAQASFDTGLAAHAAGPAHGSFASE